MSLNRNTFDSLKQRINTKIVCGLVRFEVFVDCVSKIWHMLKSEKEAKIDNDLSEVCG